MYYRTIRYKGQKIANVKTPAEKYQYPDARLPPRIQDSLCENLAALAAHHRFARRFPQLRLYLTQDRRWKERFWLNMFDAVALALHHQALKQPPSRSR